MESLPIPVGYGIELAVLLDTARVHGLDAVAQVDLGRRGHKHQSSHDLAVMAAEIMLTAVRRRPGPGSRRRRRAPPCAGSSAKTSRCASAPARSLPPNVPLPVPSAPDPDRDGHTERGGPVRR